MKNNDTLETLLQQATALEKELDSVRRAISSHPDSTGSHNTDILNENNLLDEQRQYRLLFEGSNDALFIHEISDVKGPGRFLDVNQVACRRLGYSREELLSLGPGDIDASERLPETRKTLEKILKDGHVLFEMEHLTKNGAVIPVEINAHILDLGGRKLVLSIARDITERKKTERALLKSESMLNETGRIAKVGGWELNLETNQLTWTRQVYRIHEVSDTFMPDVAKAISFYHPDSREAISNAVRLGMEKGLPWDLELKFITANNRHLWVRAIGRAQKEEGRVVRLSGTFQDITELKKAADELMTSQTKYKVLVETIPATVYLFDKIANNLFLSPGVKDLLGYDPAVFTNNPEMFSEVIHPEDAAWVRDQFGISYNNLESLDIEYRMIHREGFPVWVRDQAAVLTDADGSAVAVQGVLTDINTQKKTEKRLIDARKMAEAANQIKSRFLASMSHELRTPLNAILGFSEVLGDELYGDLNKKQAEYIQYISTSGQHLLQLVNDVLDLAKVEAGRVQLILEDLEIRGLLESSLSLFTERCKRKSIQLAVGIEQDLYWVPIRADHLKVKQIMYNLLANAIKFTPYGGAITVSCHKADKVVISVSDTGIGIEPDNLERVFEEFEQADTRADKEGTGLGLALARDLVVLHGGRIWAESEGKGKGSVFSFTLPVGS